LRKGLTSLLSAAAGIVLLAGPACGAVGEFFWAGFYVADAAVNKAAIEKVLYDNFDTAFRSERTGATKTLLGRLKWDEFGYYESAANRSHVHENLLDLYGVFVSIDKVLKFAPDSLSVAGVKRTFHHTYVFATFNVFAADTRNLVYSHPFFLTQTSEQATAPEAVIKAALAQLPDKLKDAQDGFTIQLMAGLQSYFGAPGTSKEAIRRTKKPLHKADTAAENTFGVNAICADCVTVADQSKRTVVNAKAMGDFARFFLNARLARYKQVAFLPEQKTIVQERTGDAAATAKEGDVTRNFDEVCVPAYDKTGASTICVRVLPPRNPIWIGIRSMVKPRTNDARLDELRFMTAVDLEAELAGRKEPFKGELTSVYDVPTVQDQKVSDVYYVNGIIKAIEQLERDTIR